MVDPGVSAEEAERARAEAEKKAAEEAEAKRAAEAKAKKDAEEKAKAEAKAKALAEERARAEAEAAEKAKREAEAKAKADAEEKARLAAEAAAAKAKQEAEDKAKKEAEAEAKKAAEAKAKAEAEKKAQIAAEAKAKKEAEAKAQKEAEAEEAARLKAAEQARLKAETEAKKKAAAKAEAAAKAKAAAEEKSRLEVEAKAKKAAEAKAKKEAEAQAEKEAKKEAEEKAKAEAAQKAKLAEEAKAKKAAEAKAKAEAEEQARLEAEAKKEADAKAKADKEAAAKAKQEAAAKAKAAKEAEALAKAAEEEEAQPKKPSPKKKPAPAKTPAKTPPKKKAAPKSKKAEPDPEPTAPADLGQTYRRLIKQTGPISLAHYMAESNARYYTSRDPLGEEGDFITAPEVSQMFGELIGLWMADLWVRMGARKRIHYVELGPGRGTLASDALRTAKRYEFDPQIHFVETSPALRELQSKEFPDAVHHDDLTTLPDDAPLLIVANEFFDALPIHQLVRSAQGWHERMIGLEDDEFAFVAGSEPMDSIVPKSWKSASQGTMIETSPAASAVMAEIAQRLSQQGGAALVIDYGSLELRAGSTLQAIRAHEKVDPLTHPGEADLTAHVDFEMLADVAKTNGADVMGLEMQGEWLRQMGIDTRHEALQRKNPAEADKLKRQYDRLVQDNQMGLLFKVLGICGRRWPNGVGFD